MKKVSLIYNIICGMFIILFAYTGLSKLLDLKAFRFDLNNNFAFLYPYDLAVALFIPILEIVLAIMLIFSKLQRLALIGCLILMVFFTGYVAQILSTHDLPCTCGGIMREMSWTQHLWFNSAFTLFAVVAIFLSKSKRSADVSSTGIGSARLG